jgi:DNA-binding beta-propeller fold protein YncE
VRRLALVLLADAGLAAVAAGVHALTTQEGRIGPDKRLLNNGRRLTPHGHQVRLGQFPTGAAVTPDGRFLWAVDSGRGMNDVKIVSVRSGRVLQTLELPGASGGIAMDPSGRRVYVSGVAESAGRPLQHAPASVLGRKGDVIHVFTYDKGTGSAHRAGVIAVPPPASAGPPQNFPPTNLPQRVAWPDRLAVSPDGRRLLVPLNLADAAAIVTVATKQVRYVQTGNYPYGAAILRDGRTGLVSNETPGTVSVIDLDRGRKVKDIQVGPRRSHPESITLDPKADRAYVPLANSDQVVVLDTERLRVQRTLSVERPAGLGASPVDTAVTPDGRRLLVAEAGTDSISIFALPGGRRAVSRARRDGEKVLAHEVARAAARTAARSEEDEEGDAEERAGARAAVVRAAADFTLVGRIPTGQYPTDVEATSARQNPCGLRRGKRRTARVRRCAKVLYVSGKGLGSGPNPRGPQPNTPDDTDAGINRTQYLPLLNIGSAGIADMPSARTLRTLTARAERQIRPTNAQKPPTGTPLRPGGPIKHVFFIVRENRTYDQILGDDPRGDGDPKLALFGREITPNAHVLAQRFPLLDHVYANSEASIDGHFWTSAAKVSDYVNKNWFQNYAGRGRPYDFGVYSVTWPGNGFLFDQAIRQRISFFNYGEAIAGTIGLFPDKDRDGADQDEVDAKFLNSDLGTNGCYGNDASIGEDAITGLEIYDGAVPSTAKAGATSRSQCFALRFAAQSLAGQIPTFNYLVLTNDHTETLTAGKRTPRSMIADNDEGLGRIVSTISHSPIWKSSAIFVVEDDSQDGADHVDAHRIPAFAISPYTPQGKVVHTRYDLLSVIRSMELIMGMEPLGLFDALATPMYDAFSATPDNDRPYDFISSPIDKTERNPGGTRGARDAARLPRCLDCIAQPDMDRLLWQSVHGQGTEPPPPGPNAEGRDKPILGDG